MLMDTPWPKWVGLQDRTPSWIKSFEVRMPPLASNRCQRITRGLAHLPHPAFDTSPVEVCLADHAEQSFTDRQEMVTMMMLIIQHSPQRADHPGLIH